MLGTRCVPKFGAHPLQVLHRLLRAHRHRPDLHGQQAPAEFERPRVRRGGPGSNAGRQDVPGSDRLYGNFDIILDHFWRVSQLHPTHTRRVVCSA